jgi:8-oxo-dGTP pyrophosphatase MutT (NUDIX family)
MDQPFTILARGPWARPDVHVVYDSAPPRVDETLVSRAWSRAEEEARASGKLLFPGRVAGLASFVATSTTLSLTLHRTDYRAFVGTNLAPDYLATGAPRADALGISVLIETGDLVLLHRRGAGCYEWPLAIDTPGGHVTPDAGPFDAALEELESELGVRASEVTALSVMGLARIRATEKPQLVIAARVSLDVDAIRARLPHARESFETQELLPIARPDLAELARSTRERITPAGRAALLLASGNA